MLVAYASGGSGNSNRGTTSSSIENLIKSGKDKYAYSDSELRKLAKAHQNGSPSLKKKIEDRLTDINFHTEASSFSSGDYTTYDGRSLLGRTQRTSPQPVVRSNSRLTSSLADYYLRGRTINPASLRGRSRTSLRGR